MNPIAIIEGVRQGGKALGKMGKFFKRNIDRRRTPVVGIAWLQADGDDDRVILVAQPTTEIRRKKRRGVRYLAAMTPNKVPIWTEEQGQAVRYDSVETAIKALQVLIHRGHARID